MDTERPCVLGLLQNMWVRDAAYARRMVAKYGQRVRFRMIATWMPASPSGQALQAAFGDLFELITWENVASRITGRSDCTPRADHVHIGKLLVLCRPDIVLAFGRTAVDAMGHHDVPKLIRARHPSPRARRCKTLPTLAEAAAELRRELASAD